MTVRDLQAKLDRIPGNHKLVMYADDGVIFTDSPEELLIGLRSILSEYGLELSEPKTHMRVLGEDMTLKFLGLR